MPIQDAVHNHAETFFLLFICLPAYPQTLRNLLSIYTMLLVLCCLLLLHHAHSLTFNDVFARSGLLQGAPATSLKFGGPFVGDVNSDGYPDLILTFHNRNRTRIYLQKRESPLSFTLFRDPRTGRPFSTRVLDLHGVSVIPVSAISQDKLLVFSVGGGSGTMLRTPEIYRMDPMGGFSDVSEDMGLGEIRSRPRNVLAMDLGLETARRKRRRGGGVDLLNVNFLVPRNGMSIWI